MGNPQITMGYANDIYASKNVNMWGKYDTVSKKWLAEPVAYSQAKGIWTHVSYVPDKSDCQPQPELVNLLKTLK